jgi:hypothetical protein
MDFSINGRLQNFGSFEVVADSGTSLLGADKEMKRWLEEHLQPWGCSDISRLPKVSLQLSETVSLPMFPSDYIDQVDGQCSLAIMPKAIQGYNHQRLILGDSFLRRYITIFARSRRQLGFGVSADDAMAHELLPAMFPKPASGPPKALMQIVSAMIAPSEHDASQDRASGDSTARFLAPDSGMGTKINSWVRPSPESHPHKPTIVVPLQRFKVYSSPQTLLHVAQ